MADTVTSTKRVVDYRAVVGVVIDALRATGQGAAGDVAARMLASMPGKVTRKAIDGYGWTVDGISVRTLTLLSAPGKMPHASFSIPAGASCPASGVAQRAAEAAGQGAETVCSVCYAEKGFYLFKSTRETLALRFAFVRASLRVDAGATFVAAIAVAIACDAARDGGAAPYCFRVHDAGDVFSPAYAAAWGAIADVVPVRFWIPTREYIRPVMREALVSLARRANVTVRPSGIMRDGRTPNLVAEGFGPGSGVATSRDQVAPDAYVCPATVAGNVPTCEANGCRMCWAKDGAPIAGFAATARALPVVYLAH